MRAILGKTVKNLRTYGKAPFNVVVIHGGPGAPGHMAPVARELSPEWGVLEPFQTAMSLEGQVQELKNVLDHSDLPVVLVGSSWGAMLGYIFTARYPGLVRKLILIGSAVFEEQYATHIQEIRLSRLSEEERREAHPLIEILKNPLAEDKTTALVQLGKLFVKADAYNPLTLDTENLEVRHDIYQSVWSDATELRRSGELLELGVQIQCPVVAIHGDNDPHPFTGIQKPLSSILKGFKFILLENCGHLPWIEREARDGFYKILKEELA